MVNRELNVGVIISPGIKTGGGYQYEYMVLEILKKYHKNNEINLKYFVINKNILKDYLDLNIPIKVIRERILEKIHRNCLSYIFLYHILKKIGLKYSKIEIELQRNNIDIVYFLSPSILCQALSNIPYIFTLWDLGHLDVLEFPEVSYDKEFERREHLYTNSLKKAYKIIAESNYGKEYAVKKYQLDEKRIDVLKLLPNIRVNDIRNHINIKKKYEIENDYIFYPAQFWAHKNHIYILKAIKLLKYVKDNSIDVIFSGADKGNLEYILEKAKEYNIEDLVHYIGFASIEEIPYLYKQSLALVMPTYLGPTNLPPLEAFAYEVPVCYSDTPFFREQVGDAAFFMDLNDPQSLVEHLITIRNNDKKVERKITRGKQLLNDWKEIDFYNMLEKVFNEYKYVRETWGR